MNSDLKTKIEDLWENQENENFTNKSTRDFIFEVLSLLDKGEERIAQKEGGNWKINEWLKKAILLSFRTNKLVNIVVKIN